MSTPPAARPDGAPPIDVADLVVVPMRRRHLAAVLAIEGLVYPRPWSSRLFEEELERRNRVYLVARAGEVVVGYAGLLMIADDGHVATVAVHPSLQGRGIGGRLLHGVVCGALGLGANQLTLEVRMSNVGAQALYRRFGFVPGGARKAYYADNGEDALVMWAHHVTEPPYLDQLRELDRRFPGRTVLEPGTPAHVDLVTEGAGPVGEGIGSHPAATAARMDGP